KGPGRDRPTAFFWHTGGWRSSILPGERSRWRLPTAGWGASTTARSTTMPKCVPRSERLAHPSQRVILTPKWCWPGSRHGWEEIPGQLNGMWAFAIYDCDGRRLFLSRDRFGQKPLYYTFQNGTFVFASEATGLFCHPRVRSSVSALAVRKYFAYGFIPAPHS